MKLSTVIPVALTGILVAAAPLAAQTAKPAGPVPVTRDAYTKNVDTAFAGVDSNKDGSLSLAEISAAEVKVNQQLQSQILARKKQAFEAVDTDKNGSISFAEFGAAMKTQPVVTDGKAALAQYDTNKDGKISQAEFRAPALSKFSAADANKDGTVSVAEQQKASAR